MQTQEFLARAHLEADVLTVWLEADWLIPDRKASRLEFSDADVARAHLILDLKDMGVNDESMTIVLDLIDQVHGLRRRLRSFLQASGL
jgi:chaperone modulatory protein CbpM